MFSPEMMANAQKMMQNMSPEQFAQMSQMAANMDPSVLQRMAGSMGQNVDAAEAQRQMKNMTQDQMKQSFQEAQRQMGSRNQYMRNGATTLKNEGNELLKLGKYTEAKAKYELAKTNLAADYSDDAKAIKKACTLNLALCKLKLEDYHGTIQDCEEILKEDSESTKALYRRGQAYVELGELQQGCVDIRRANEISPQEATKRELERVRHVMKEKGIEEVDEAIEPPKLSKSANKSTSGKSANSASTSVSSSSAKPGVHKSFAPCVPEVPVLLNQGMRNRMGPGGAVEGADLAQMQNAMKDMMNDPEMMKMAEEMMKNTTPEQMASIAKAQGIELHSGKAKVMLKINLWAVTCMRWLSTSKSWFTNIFMHKGHLVLLFVIVFVCARGRRSERGLNV